MRSVHASSVCAILTGLTRLLSFAAAVKEKLNKLNTASYLFSFFLVVMVSGCATPAQHSTCARPDGPCASNFIISCILILGYYSAGKTSVTGLISSALLVAPRCLAWFMCATNPVQPAERQRSPKSLCVRI